MSQEGFSAVKLLVLIVRSLDWLNVTLEHPAVAMGKLWKAENVCLGS